MALIARKVLEALQGIYRTVDAPPSRIDFENPITPVHDLGREAELGAAPGPNYGFFIHHSEYNLTAGTTQYMVEDLYDYLEGTSWGATFDPRDFWIWYMGAVSFYVVQAGQGDIDAVMIGLEVPDAAADFMTGTLPAYFPIFQALTDQAFIRIQTSAIAHVSYAAARNPYVHPPLWLPRGTLLRGRVEPNAAIATNPGGVQDVLFWAGRRGTTPPGAR